MSVERSNELPPGTVKDALATYGRIQRTRVEALYNLHRAVFAESLVATLLPNAQLSPDPAHEFDITWHTTGFNIRIEVKCSGEYLPRYGIDHRSPAEWNFPIQKRVWDYNSRKHALNTDYRFDVLILARHVGEALEAGWTFYVLNAVQAGEFGGRATKRTVQKLKSVSPVYLATAVRDAHSRLLALDSSAP